MNKIIPKIPEEKRVEKFKDKWKYAECAFRNSHINRI